MANSVQNNHFIFKVNSCSDQVNLYENPNLQAKALSVIPAEQLRQQASQDVEDNIEIGVDDALAKRLMLWFKSEFFEWVNSPACWNCSGSTVYTICPQKFPLPPGADRVEQYVCEKCRAEVQFVRYNDPGKLLETRRGRCGEWANAFTLCCRAMGLDARLVVDWTDHVWTEIYSVNKSR